MGLWMYLRAIAAPRRAWALLAAVGLGLLVALTLLSMVPLYTSLVDEAHLQYTLASAAPAAVNLDVQAESFAIEPQIVASALPTVDRLAHATIADFTAGSMTFLQTWNAHLRISAVNGLDPRYSGALPDPINEAAVYGYDMRQAGPHIHLFAGRLPQDATPGQLPEALVTNQMSGVSLGDTITLKVGGGSSHSVTARVVGIWYPADTRDRFWNGFRFDYIPPPPKDPPPPATWPLVLSEGGFLSALNFGASTDGTHLVGDVGMIAHVVYFPNGESITPASVAARIASVKRLRSLVDAFLSSAEVYHGTLATNLDGVLAGALTQKGLLDQPLAMVVAQLVGLALFFVVAMARVLVDGQAVEIATLKSRGASEAQLLAGYGLQGIALAALIALPAALLGSAVSATVVGGLIPTPVGTTEYDLAPGYLQRYLAGSISPQVLLLPALLGLAVGAVALVVAALRSARLDVLALRREQGRSTSAPFWQRYYLDIGLAVLCVAGYLELATFGTLGVRAALAGQGSAPGTSAAAAGPDPFIVAAPGLLLLAGALLVLRLFPHVARLGAWSSARLRGAAGMLAFEQVARGAASGLGRLTLLLTLAVGLGLFGLTFQASLAQNAHDRAAYRAGGDELIQLTPNGERAGINPRFAQLPGVTASMPAFRTDATPSDANLLDVHMLAVDPSSCARVTYWRADYADQPLAALMAEMRAHAQGVDAGDPEHPLWALVDPALASTLHVRVGDTFHLTPQSSDDQVTYVVGGVIGAFPTLFDAASSGYLIVDLDDYFAAINRSAANPTTAPNEYWLRTTDEAAFAAAIGDPTLQVATVVSRRKLAADFAADPLEIGMIGLLLVGAAVAAMLALVGSIVQAALSARQRVGQFAILRTLGMSIPQLVRMLLAEQAIVYCFALAAGTLLGGLLSTVTLPFLQFGSSLISPDEAGAPAFVLAVNPGGVALFYGIVLVAFIAAPLLAGQFATSLRLGKTLRLGED
jgi:ABC-type lipoprotein release transport system permease subunit